MCCSVLKCVDSAQIAGVSMLIVVLQFVAVCRNVLQCIAVCRQRPNRRCVYLPRTHDRPRVIHVCFGRNVFLLTCVSTHSDCGRGCTIHTRTYDTPRTIYVSSDRNRFPLTRVSTRSDCGRGQCTTRIQTHDTPKVVYVSFDRLRFIFHTHIHLQRLPRRTICDARTNAWHA